jgi:hypothetical protein
MTAQTALQTIQDIAAHTELTDLEKLGSIYDILQQVPDLWGCTDRLAMNYNRWAKIDDGSCQYVAVNPET